MWLSLALLWPLPPSLTRGTSNPPPLGVKAGWCAMVGISREVRCLRDEVNASQYWLYFGVCALSSQFILAPIRVILNVFLGKFVQRMCLCGPTLVEGVAWCPPLPPWRGGGGWRPPPPRSPARPLLWRGVII